MTSGNPSIALRGKMTKILLKVAIENYQMLCYCVFLTLLVFYLRGVVTYAPNPIIAKLAETATGAHVNVL